MQTDPPLNIVHRVGLHQLTYSMVQQMKLFKQQQPENNFRVILQTRFKHAGRWEGRADRQAGKPIDR